MDKEEIKSVWSECANGLDKKDIQMLKAFAKPP